MDRRKFVQGTAIAGSAVGLSAVTMLGQAAAIQEPQDSKTQEKQDDKKTEQPKERPPRLELEMVQEFVGVSHGKFERVKEMLESEPKLVNATHDWGAGDFESAIGAASHVGNRQIAIYLLEHGARMNVFCAAMLGRLDIVKPMLEAYPSLVHNPGPHGIPLIAHAKYGGFEARSVHDFIQNVLERNPKPKE